MKLWNYLRGYVNIAVEGYFLEKFINICTHRRIYLWDLKIQNNCTMFLKVSIKGFKRIRHVARKAKCRVRIKSKVGIPFILYRYRKRKALFFGVIVFILILQTFSSFIWTVDIKGNKIIPKENIIRNLADLGLYVGRLKYGIQTDKIVTSMEILMDDIGWIGIVINGTKAEVQIVERVITPKVIEKDKPCDIIAYNDGIITNLTVKAGNAVVKVGDTVKKGQVLVSGTIPSRYETQPARVVHAIATVLARTWYEEFRGVERTVVNVSRTGHEKSRYSILFFNRRINFYRKDISFDKFEQLEKIKILSLGRNMQLPIGVVINTYYELKDICVELSEEEARRIAADKAIEAIMDKLPAETNIQKTDVNFIEKSDGSIVADVVIECVEDIGIQHELK